MTNGEWTKYHQLQENAFQLGIKWKNINVQDWKKD